MKTNNISFKSGLNQNLLRKCRQTSPAQVERILSNKNIESNLDSCKPIAFSIQKILKIFDILKQKTGSKLFEIPAPRIITYLKDNLDFNFTGWGLCVPITQKILKNQPPYETGSIFYQKEDSIEIFNEKLNKSFQRNERSSSHYLSPFIHEILHSVYLHNIYQKYGYEGNCPYTRSKYAKPDAQGFRIMEQLSKLTFSDNENCIIEKFLGKYATNPDNQYHEVFAETLTKLICDSLSEKDSMPYKNPLEEISKYPKEFLQILLKTLRV